MASNRIGRINEEIQRELSELLRSLKDPRVQKTMISVTRVDTTNDLRYAKVYVSFIPEDHPKTRLAELKKTEGFVRSALARKLSIYKVPEIHFLLDETAYRSARIEAALKKEEADLSKLPVSDEEDI
jgi:ribosome-binding factor A